MKIVAHLAIAVLTLQSVMHDAVAFNLSANPRSLDTRDTPFSSMSVLGAFGETGSRIPQL